MNSLRTIKKLFYMTGMEFYLFLQQTLQIGQVLHELNGYTFNQWLWDEDLQFTIPNNNPKAIPMNIIIAAKDAYNIGIPINNEWLKDNNCSRGWCLASVLNRLFATYDP
jgi:hypothetical protein